MSPKATKRLSQRSSSKNFNCFSSEHMVRFGVIGCGCIGKEHINNLLLAPEVAELVALVDPEPDMLAAASALAPGVPCFSSHKEMVNVEAAIVAVPNHQHVDVCLDLVRAGLHILCEKPVATTMEDCERLAKELGDKVFAVGLEYRHIPPMRRLLEDLDTIGSLRMVTVREHRFPFLNKVGAWNREDSKTGGTLVEKGCHFFDFFSLCCKAKPTTVYARGSQAVNHLDSADVLDHAVVVVDFDNGVLCTLELCMFAEASMNQLEVSAVGSRGKLEAFAPAHGVKHDTEQPNFRAGYRLPRDWDKAVDAPTEDHTCGAVTEEHVPIDEHLMAAGDHAGSTYYELLEFAHACQGHPSNLASIYDAALSLAVGLAAHQSIEAGRPVDVRRLIPAWLYERKGFSDDASTSTPPPTFVGDAAFEENKSPSLLS